MIKGDTDKIGLLYERYNNIVMDNFLNRTKIRDRAMNIVGIPDNKVNYIFECYYRVVEYDGLGQGIELAMVKEICWLHNGEIHLNSSIRRKQVLP